MKKIKLLAPIFAASAIAASPTISSCSNKALEVSINSSDYVITDQSINLTYKLSYPQKIGRVKWTVSDTSIATISPIGKLTGIKQGVVTAKVEISVNNEVKVATKDIVVIDKNNFKFLELLETYSYFLNNYLQSTNNFKIEPIGEYADMEYRDQIIDNIVLTTFPTYPNQHYLKINTTKQRRYNFCAAGRSVADVYKLITDMYTDAVNELKNEQYLEQHYSLKETYDISVGSIYYQVVAESTVSSEPTLYLIELRINSYGFIEQFVNTTAPAAGHASEEYGCFEIRYKEQNNL